MVLGDVLEVVHVYQLTTPWKGIKMKIFEHSDVCTVPIETKPFEFAEFKIFAVRGPPKDHVSEGILEKDQLEAEIWLFSKHMSYLLQKIISPKNKIRGNYPFCN